MSFPDNQQWTECARHPGTFYDRGIAPHCIRCVIDVDAAIEAADRERRIEEKVEVFRRCLPLIVAALRELDESR